MRRPLPDGYEIRAAGRDDPAALPAIEREAAAAFCGYLQETGLDLRALEEVTTVEEFERAMRGGRLWIATRRSAPVAFAQVEIVAGYAHLEEIDVHPAHARQGLGRALVETVCDWARSQSLPAVTLTTFRDVPWNARYYERMGFVAVDAASLSTAHADIVRDEASRGFDPAKRVMMKRRL